MVETEKIINQLVTHKDFGVGVIRNADDKYLEVDFTNKRKVSTFAYPSCFYSFLVLEDSDLQTEINVLVEEWKQESGIVQKEELKHQYEKTVQGIKGRRLAAEDKKRKAAQKVMEHRLAYNSVQ